MKIAIAIPVFNEEAVLEKNALRLYNFLKKNPLGEWKIIIADNASTDKTGEIGRNLAANYERVKYLRLDENGKGRAIRAAWENELADVYCFMDADLATDLSSLPKLVSAIGQENYDLAAGSRFLPKSRIQRSILRKFVSRVYRFCLHGSLGLKTKDAPCGFKAVNRKIVESILPKVKNNEWFFDTEMIFLAEKNNYRIKEIPISWTEHKNARRKSRVKFIKVSLRYLKEIWRLKKYAGN